MTPDGTAPDSPSEATERLARGPPPSTLPATWAVWGALILANAALTTGPIFVRAADVGPVAAGFWRLLIAAPLLCALALATRHRSAPLQLDRALLVVMALAGLFFAADLASWHLGIMKTKLANATLLGNTASVMFPVYGFVIARAMPGGRQILAILLALAGAAMLVGRSYALSPDNMLGDLLCILAGLFYTLYFIAIDRARSRVAPLPLLAMSTLSGVLPMLAFAWIMGERIWPGDWRPLVALALASQLVGQSLMVFAIGHLKPLVIGLGLLMQPVLAAMFGWLLFGERLGAPDIVGMVLIAAALVMIRGRASSRPLPAGQA